MIRVYCDTRLTTLIVELFNVQFVLLLLAFLTFQRGEELGGGLQVPDDEAGAVGEAGRGLVQRPPEPDQQEGGCRGRGQPLLGREGGVGADQRRHAL